MILQTMKHAFWMSLNVGMLCANDPSNNETCILDVIKCWDVFVQMILQTMRYAFGMSLNVGMCLFR